jgi:hypothetical protein
MKILDATCGSKGIWYIKNHPFVTFMDKRKETVLSNHKHQKKREYVINPDIISEWKDAPFPDNYFDIVIFDPPHLIINRDKPKLSTMDKQYGNLYKDNWRQELKIGIKKLFDILKPEGVFILKWCENSVKVDEIIKMCPYPPLFGSNTKGRGHTANFWIMFIKYNVNKTVGNFFPTENIIAINQN